MGNDDLEQMNNGTMEPSGRDMTNAGRICGMVATGLFALQVIVMLFMLVVMLGSAR